eukprot:snap_masked-scaffold_23-processed-gene-0.14-mRNA-1 protein AED:1.00 eAED:1.00 QI:0/0/0/0/1/1/7/0/142
MNSIQQQYEENPYKTDFRIKWEHDKYGNPINTGEFKREIEEFVKGFQPIEEVSLITFRYCPFDAVKSIFVRFILCFPAMKELRFRNCRFSKKNFINFQQLKILKLNRLVFYECNIPEVSSFCIYLKTNSMQNIYQYWRNDSK